jgi:lysosomal alpha-mannosidase
MVVPIVKVCVLVFIVFGAPSACTQSKINVHLVPHTHDDVGWLKTVDQYYYGDLNEIQHAGVQYILDSVIDALVKNPNRKFIYVEMAFFTRWWNIQSDDIKNQVHELVKNGQFEFINGGWCMNDEASTHYNAIIDQMSLGLRFISNTFGVRPTVGWHIDPFGHSSVQAYLFSLMGFDSFYFGRIDYFDKAVRLLEADMEIMWSGSQSLGPVGDIFTGVTYNNYGPPLSFCYDQSCADPPIMDDHDLAGYNVDERVYSFINYSIHQAEHFKTNNIMMTMGEDFNYENANLWYKNLDKLISYVQKNDSSINVMYSTPSIYTQYVNEDQDLKLSLKTDDFFPYADTPWSYWTGYFTSRPALKGYVRKSNSLLQSCKQLEAVNPKYSDIWPSSITLQRAMAVAQHHDAVSGTEKQHVANDYTRRLFIGGVECEVVMATMLSHLVSNNSQEKMELRFCEHLNISICSPAESGEFKLVVYNPLGRPWSGIVRLPLIGKGVNIFGPDGKPVLTQFVPLGESTLSIRKHFNVSSLQDVVFPVTDVPPLGYYMYTSHVDNNVESVSALKEHLVNDDLVIKNEYYNVVFDGATGHMKSITNIVSGISCDVDQEFLWYNASAGNNKNSTQPSGAYIFRTNTSTPFNVNNNNNKATISTIDGDVVTEVHQAFAPWISQVVRLYKGQPAIEVEFTVGPIPIEDHLGKEIISRFTTNLETNAIWYTDANGRDMQKRVRNYRPTWRYNNTCPVAGNYYPVNSRIYIKDVSKDVQFTILTDRSQGGSSMMDGSIELMVHRRLLYDDKRGVGEPLNETGLLGEGLVIKGKHWVILDDQANSTYNHRMLAERIMLEPQLSFIYNSSNSKQNYSLMHTGLSAPLPDNVHLLTLERLDDTTVLLRLDHQFEASDPTPPLNGAQSVKLNGLFNAFKITSVTELALGANVALSEVKKLQWNLDKGSNQAPDQLDFPPVIPPDYEVKLTPMLIRTFNLTVEFVS